MPASHNVAAAEVLATALTTPVVRGLLDGGFATFAPQLRAVDERIRLQVPPHGTSLTLELLLAALRRRRAAEPRHFHVIADTQPERQSAHILVLYRDRWGTLCATSGTPEEAGLGTPGTAAFDLTVHVHPDDVTDTQAADKLVDRFLGDLANAPARSRR